MKKRRLRRKMVVDDEISEPTNVVNVEEEDTSQTVEMSLF